MSTYPEEFSRLEAENKKLQEEIERLNKFIADNETILTSAHTDVERMKEYLDKILGLVKKLLSAFPKTLPDGIDTVSFDIPGYIVEELRQALQD